MGRRETFVWVYVAHWRCFGKIVDISDYCLYLWFCSQTIVLFPDRLMINEGMSSIFRGYQFIIDWTPKQRYQQFNIDQQDKWYQWKNHVHLSPPWCSKDPPAHRHFKRLLEVSWLRLASRRSGTQLKLNPFQSADSCLPASGTLLLIVRTVCA